MKNKKQSKRKSINKPKKKYKVRNWHEYNESLKRRGSLEYWLEQGIISGWTIEFPDGTKKTRGAVKKYSNKAIEVSLQFGKIFHQRLRQTEGLLNSLFKLAGIDLKAPDFTTLSRRAGSLEIKIPIISSKTAAIIVDSTGLKVFGEGEWKVRKHGYSKHRTWKKFSIAVTTSGEIRASVLTGNNTTDSEPIADLLDQAPEQITSLIGDGGYDKRNVYQYTRKRKIGKVLIPPQCNGKIWQHGNCKSPPHPRDENLRNIRKTSRSKWKSDSGYHVRSLVENAFFRFKTIFGDRLHARKFENQVAEVMVAASALNKMSKLGMPSSYVTA